MKKLTTIGRILFALPFGILGINHFIMADFYIGIHTSFIPNTGFTVFLVGLLLIATSITIIINKYIQISCLLLATLLLIFIITIHIPNLMGHENYALNMISLMKDTGLLGGALMIAGITKNKN